MSERSSIYLAYLESQHWYDLRASALNRANRRCEACERSKGALHGHHLIYRNPLESCTEEDIMALCGPCHMAIHDWLKATNRQLSFLSRESTRGVLLGIGSTPLKPRKLKTQKAKRVAKQSRLRAKDLKSLGPNFNYSRLDRLSLKHMWLERSDIRASLATGDRKAFKALVRTLTENVKERNRLCSAAMTAFDEHHRIVHRLPNGRIRSLVLDAPVIPE